VRKARVIRSYRAFCRHSLAGIVHGNDAYIRSAQYPRVEDGSRSFLSNARHWIDCPRRNLLSSRDSGESSGGGAPRRARAGQAKREGRGSFILSSLGAMPSLSVPL
jgi:hypothetical protein